ELPVGDDQWVSRFDRVPEQFGRIPPDLRLVDRRNAPANVGYQAEFVIRWYQLEALGKIGFELEGDQVSCRLHEIARRSAAQRPVLQVSCRHSPSCLVLELGKHPFNAAPLSRSATFDD